MKEEWKDIVGYEGLYQVSNLGRVKSFDKVVKNAKGTYIKKERYLKPQKISNGYFIVGLYKNKKHKNIYIHKIVAEAFLDNSNCYEEINHIDGNKENNVFSNLEYCSRNYNQKHSYIKGLTSRYKTRHKIEQYDLKGKFIREWNSISEASNCLCIERTGISKCCNKKLKSSNNYIWKYKDII